VQHICGDLCGTDFDKPGTCEGCLEDPHMQMLFDYEISQVHIQGVGCFMNL
jgi:hypothetical protein